MNGFLLVPHHKVLDEEYSPEEEEHEILPKDLLVPTPEAHVLCHSYSFEYKRKRKHEWANDGEREVKHEVSEESTKLELYLCIQVGGDVFYQGTFDFLSNLSLKINILKF